MLEEVVFDTPCSLDYSQSPSLPRCVAASGDERCLSGASDSVLDYRRSIESRVGRDVFPIRFTIVGDTLRIMVVNEEYGGVSRE